MTEILVILGGVIRDYMELDDSRVAQYNQNFTKPKDDKIFVILSQGTSRVVSNIFNFDDDTNEEVMTSTLYTPVNVEISSKNEDAKLRAIEVIMAIDSTIGQRAAEDNQIRFFRNGDIADISAVDGGSGLHRLQIPIIISHVETKRRAIIPIDRYQPTTTEVENNG